MVSRRSILRGATGIAAVAPLAVALDALAGEDAPRPAAGGAGDAGGAPGAADVPDTLANRRTGLASGSRVADTDFPLTHLGLSWTGQAAAVRLRTPAGWGDWRELHGCEGGQDAAPGQAGRAMLAGAGAIGYEVRVTGGTADALELNTVDGPRRATAAPEAPLPLPAAPGTLAGSPDGFATPGGLAGAAGSRGPRLRLPTYLSRACWGADESFRLNPDGTVDTPPVFIPVQTLTVHHTGFDDDAEPAATVRAIYYNQAVVNDWGDIGYQLLIDAEGRVYEGTYSDPDPVPVFGPELGPDGRPQMVNGAHVGGFNAGNVGVALLGDFTARQPTKAARRSLTLVLALLSATCRLDPTGTTNYVNPFNGFLATIATISGHRDWNAANPDAGPTLCPGDTFHPTLPALRRDVARLLRPLG